LVRDNRAGKKADKGGKRSEVGGSYRMKDGVRGIDIKKLGEKQKLIPLGKRRRGGGGKK